MGSRAPTAPTPPPVAPPPVPAPALALVAPKPAPTSIEDALAPVMGLVCDLHKALALMPAVTSVSIELTISRSGAVEIAPPKFLTK